jgi:toxin ParE1/3/4
VIVQWTRRALLQLADQLDYIALDKPSAADRMAGLVHKSAAMLGAWPELGKIWKQSGTRMLAIPRTPFLLIYRVSTTQIVIVQLLHGAQNK